MPRFEPFAAVRYDTERVDLADVVAPPYDVIGPEERARLEARHPYNVVHVDLARDEGARNRYESARRRFGEWLAEGVLVVEPDPSFWLYRMGWRDEGGRPRQTSGVLGAVALDPDGTGAVLPHERTMAKPMDDRLKLMRACTANVSPIWGVSLAPGLSALTEPAGPPDMRCTDEDGVHHRLWRVLAPAATEAIAATVASAPLVIADGHHRYETALAYRAERRGALGDEPGPYDLVLTYVTPLADDDLGVRPIHRMIAGLPATFPLLEALSASFTVEPAGVPSDDLPARAGAEGALGLAVPGAAYLLRPRAPWGGDEVVDSERLEHALGTLPAHEITYHHDAGHVLALLDKGDVQAGVFLRPTTMAQIAAAARAGRRLPQKSTFFHPKPRTGLVFRLVG